MTVRGDPARQQRRPLGLRGRIAVRISAIVLVLSLGVGLATYFSVRGALLQDRRRAAVEQTVVNGRLVASALSGQGFDEAEVLAALRPPQRSHPLLLRGGEWYTTSLQVEPDDLPAALRDRVLDGLPVRQQFLLDDEPALAVGSPLGRASELAYFEVFPLGDLESTLTALRRSLIAAGSLATGLGAAVGWWAAGRAVRPLVEIGGIADGIAAGALDSRLDERSDRDLAQLASSFNRMTEALQERIQREARFASDVSHELRSPLTTIANTLAVLERRRDELSPEGREALDLLSTDLGRFQRTVGDLLEISKYDAGVVGRSDMADVQLGDFVRSVLRRSRYVDVEVSMSGEAVDAIVTVDGRRLERALRNLLDNAAIHAGGATAIDVTAHHDEIRLAVEDDGPGIAPEDRERIFERFSRGTRSRRSGRREGSGLGLALAAEDVRLHRGRLWVEDRLGGGSRFVMALPRGNEP